MTGLETRQAGDRGDFSIVGLAVAERLTPEKAALPEEIAQLKLRLYEAMDTRREFECWRHGKRFFLVDYQFAEAEPGLFVLRSKMREVPADRRYLFHANDRSVRQWNGPQTPAPQGLFTIEDLPIFRGREAP